MAKKDNTPSDWESGFTQCPNRLILVTDISPAAKVVWLAIKMHCFGKTIAYPSLTCLSNETGLSARQIMRLITELECKGYLTVERTFGRRSTYTPVTPMSLVDADSNDLILESTDQEPVTSMSRVNGNIPVTPVSPVDAKPVTSMSPTSDMGVTLIRNKKNKKEEEDVPATSKKRKAKKPKQPRKPRKPKTQTIERDPIVLRQMLDSLDEESLREKWGPKIDFESLWERFQKKVINGTPQNPKPNPYNYKSVRGMKMAIENWCEDNKASGNGNHNNYQSIPSHETIPSTLPDWTEVRRQREEKQHAKPTEK